MSTNAHIDWNPEYFADGYTKFRVGNNCFDDDVWDFNGLANLPKNKHKSYYQLKFMTIKSPRIKYTIKQFLILELLGNKLTSVIRTLCGIKYFLNFLDREFPHIDSFSKLNKLNVAAYFSFLLKSNMAAVSIKHASGFLKQIFLEGSLRGWDVPKNCLWITPLYEDMILNSPKTARKTFQITTKKAYSPETIEKIIQCALKDENIITRAMIIIQTQCGLRISEALSIKFDCIRYYEEKPKLRYITSKTKNEEVEIEAPVNALVVSVIDELKAYAKELCGEVKVPYLFITRNKNSTKPPIRPVSYTNFNRDFLRPFVKRWGIQDNGDDINLSSHYFRHFFAQGAWKGGMSAQSIMNLMNHESLVMTETYTYNLREQMNDRFIAIMSDPENLAGANIGSIKERLHNDNPFKGKTEKQINIIIEAMRLRVLPNGACIHHPGRNENCPMTDGGCVFCENYVSHKNYINVHELHAQRLSDEMERAQKQGNMVWYGKLKNEREHIEKTFIQPFKKEKAEDDVK